MWNDHGYKFVRKLIDYCCVTSHYPMSRKDRPCLCIKRYHSQRCKDRGALDIGIPESILHKCQISTRI
jgi:hypothetical protein